MEQYLENDGLSNKVPASHSTSWTDVADVEADAANMGDKETEVVGTRKIRSSSGTKKDGNKDNECDGQGKHRKILK